jgi:membrane-associated protease RseP (regulator of RpoE activity)
VGHWSTARLTGMKVTQFFMGFGPRVWSRRRGEIEWGVRALPLGAFVRNIGMNNLDEVEPGDEPRAYRSKSFPRRLLVITAGSLMHMVIAFVLLAGVYATAGKEQSTGVAVVRDIVVDGPAQRAAIALGDRLVSIDGEPISSYETLVEVVRARRAGDLVRVIYVRDGLERSVDVELAGNPSIVGVGYLGVAADDWGWERLELPGALWQGVADIGTTAGRSVTGVVQALNPLNSLRHLTDDTGGIENRPVTVVGISQISSDVGRFDGLKGILVLLASINVFVGVFNMFPLLPFDGGHAAIAVYERIRSRGGRVYRADISKMVPVATTVIALLAVLMLTGLWLDITRPLG